MKRRHLIAASVGAVGLAAGAVFSVLRETRPVGAELWMLRLQRPGGGELDFAELRGKPLLLNFWATWCPPCVTEMPLLDAFHRQYRDRGWQVVGLAVDQETPVQEFLALRRIGFPVALAGADGLAWSRALGNTGGGLPFSIVFGADGRVQASKLGVLDDKTLHRWASTLS